MSSERLIAYFDCFSGIAGDMILGALLDAGLSLDSLREELDKLNLDDYEISFQKTIRNGIAGTKFNVDIKRSQSHRKPQDIFNLIEESKLDNDIKSDAISIFRRLADAEARVHNMPVDKVHFHEVGAIDAIVDICGAVIGFRLMGFDKIYSSELILGRGLVKTEHGILPVPAPATAELVKGYPIRFGDVDSEVTTPTGAAIITTIAKFEVPDNFIVRSIGYGAGEMRFDKIPNLLRVMIGQSDSNLEKDTVMLLETNLDRVTPENLGSLIDNLMEAGALDAFITPIVMKKNRPAHRLTVLCNQGVLDKTTRIIFKSGKTLGIRIETVKRLILSRKQITIMIAGEKIGLKIAELDGEKIILPEHDDMIKLMKSTGREYDDIYFQIQSEILKGVTNG